MYIVEVEIKIKDDPYYLCPARMVMISWEKFLLSLLSNYCDKNSVSATIQISYGRQSSNSPDGIFMIDYSIKDDIIEMYGLTNFMNILPLKASLIKISDKSEVMKDD